MNKGSDKRGEVIFGAVFFSLLIPMPLALIGYWQIGGLLMVCTVIWAVTNPAFAREKPDVTELLRNSSDRATTYMNRRLAEREAQTQVAADKIA
ncbi:MAG TPA: hypothetical protein V6C81_17190 [Planktothrix sp.]|jgi:hypothetical protein